MLIQVSNPSSILPEGFPQWIQGPDTSELQSNCPLRSRFCGYWAGRWWPTEPPTPTIYAGSCARPCFIRQSIGRDDYRFFKTVKNGSNFKEFNRNEFQDFRFLTVFRLVKDFFFFFTIFSSKPCVAVLTFSVLLLPWQLHGNRSGSTTLWTKLKFKLILIILFPMAPTRVLSDKYFLSYNFLKIKIFRDFLLFFS